jgi:hypothetical protein
LKAIINITYKGTYDGVQYLKNILFLKHRVNKFIAEDLSLVEDVKMFLTPTALRFFNFAIVNPTHIKVMKDAQLFYSGIAFIDATEKMLNGCKDKHISKYMENSVVIKRFSLVSRVCVSNTLWDKLTINKGLNLDGKRMKLLINTIY